MVVVGFVDLTIPQREILSGPTHHTGPGNSRPIPETRAVWGEIPHGQDTHLNNPSRSGKMFMNGAASGDTALVAVHG